MSPSDQPGYRQWAASSPTIFKKDLIRHFTEETLAYAYEHIAMREKELADIESANGDPREIARRKERLLHWRAYAEFQEHTLEELRGEKLDRFID